MITDTNKDIDGIEYNYLNLPTRISFGGVNMNNEIFYVYDATGDKIEKRVFTTLGGRAS